ncbi:MAG: ribosome maturation factor RimP [Acidimicrobiales bacterium]|nr:ribosome maturation factor RimP [Acidimicrobiales bacterium]
MAKTDIVRTMAEPLAEAEGADVYDVTFAGGKLAVAINRQGGIDLDTLADISRELGQRLEDDDVISGSYTLEVTSPGLERPLRTPGHYAGAVGEDVTIRTKPDTEGERRVRGTILAADDTSVTVDLEDDGGRRTISFADVERARTTFSWGPQPKPGSGQGKSGSPKKHNPQNKKARS